MRTYSLSKRYESEMALITKAVEIGLNEMKKQAKGQKIFAQTDIIVIAKFGSSTIRRCEPHPHKFQSCHRLLMQWT